MSRNVLIAGWFSVPGAHTTIGDKLALDAVCAGLGEGGVPFRILLPGDKAPCPSDVKIWVSGPVDRSYPPQAEIIGNGEGWVITSSSLIVDRMGPGLADVSTARDGEGVSTKADLGFLAPARQGGFAAVLLRGVQPEYRQHPVVHERIAEAVDRAVLASALYPVHLTTRLPAFGALDRLAGGLEAVIGASEIVITSRLHGILHSLRAGRLPVVVDEIESAGKVSAFCEAFDLPLMIPAGECTVERVTSAIEQAARYGEPELAEIRERARVSASRNRDALLALVIERLKAI